MGRLDYRARAASASSGALLTMTLRLRTLKALLACSVALVPRLARAEPAPAELATARQAFESAVALEAEQKWPEASAKLRQAVAIKDTPGLRFHLAHSEERQGQLLEAALDYDRASALIAQGAKAPDVQKLLAPASAELKRRIPHLIVAIPSEVSSPVAELDGKAWPPSELALGVALNPGLHRLKVSASGHSPFERAFALKEGAQLSIRAELKDSSTPAAVTPAAVAPPAAPPSAGRESLPTVVNSSAALPAPGSSQHTSPKLYLLLGESVVTAAGLAVGIGYALAQSSARDRAQSAQGQIDQDAQDNSGACISADPSIAGHCSELRQAIADHDRDVNVSAVGFVCAGVGAAALITTWLAYPNRPPESTGVSVQPLIAIGRVGLLGRF
jgi:hypothetical protein